MKTVYTDILIFPNKLRKYTIIRFIVERDRVLLKNCFISSTTKLDSYLLTDCAPNIKAAAAVNGAINEPPVKNASFFKNIFFMRVISDLINMLPQMNRTVKLDFCIRGGQMTTKSLTVMMFNSP